MRHLLGSLGGVVLTLVLLTLLGLLVTPPVDDRPEIEEPLSMSMVEAPRQQSADNAPAPAQASPAPPAEAPPPPPAPLPAPSPSSPMAMPTPELPAMETPDIPLEKELPELTTRQPRPTPQPEPQPQRQPQPEPAPQPERVAEADATSPAENASEQGEQASAQAPASAPGPVGSPQPTRKVPPEYPARAQRRGLEGYVEVRFTIRADGSVDGDSLRVIDAEPRNVFERAAMRAISRWQFPESSSPREARQRLVFRLKG